VWSKRTSLVRGGDELKMQLQIVAWYSVDSRLSCPGIDCGTSQDNVYADPSGRVCFPS
jgi:hypothetical protein